MYFNRKNAEQKNWRMIKKGKHFLFGCSLVFAIGAALVAPSVKADTVEANPEAGSTTEEIKPVVAGDNVTYAAPAVEVAPSTLAAPTTVVTEEKAEKPVATTENAKEEAVVTTTVSVDKSQLEAVLAQAKAKNLEGQEASVKTEVAAAIAEAEALVSNGSASQDQINQSVERLTQALASVKEVTEVASETRTEATTESSETPKVRNRRAVEGSVRSVDETNLQRAVVTKENFESFFQEGGTATYDKSTGTIKLTDDVSGQVGSAYLRFKINSGQPFTFTGKVDIGNKYEGKTDADGRPGGDGVGFVFHTGKVNTIGQDGASVGMGTIKNAFGFKLDSWHNTSNPNAAQNASADPKYSYRRINGKFEYEQNAFGAFYSSNAAGKVTTVGDAKALNPNPNGQWVDFKIEYDSKKNFTVTYGSQTWTTNLSKANTSIMTTDAKNALTRNNPTFALSFLGSTGSGTNLQRVQIERFEFTAPQIVHMKFVDVSGNEIEASSAIPGDENEVVNLSTQNKKIAAVEAKGYKLKRIDHSQARYYNEDNNTVTLKPGGQLLTYIFEEKDTKAPDAPKVNSVTAGATAVTGTAEAGSTVEVTLPNGSKASAKAGQDGNFSVPVSALKEGDTVSVTATDAAGNKSTPASVTVPDTTAPATPKVNPVTAGATAVTGTAEAGSTVEVTLPNGSKASAKAGQDGNFSVPVSALKEGDTVSVTATDAAGNKSTPASVTVPDTTAPATPKVNPVTAGATAVTGTAEAGSTVEVTLPNGSKASAKAGQDGNFSVPVSALKEGDTVSVTATDAAGNKSTPASVTVPDTTAPAAPKVNPVTAGATAVTGTAEAGSTVEVTLPNGQKASAKAGDNGEFSITVPALNADDQISVKATDAANNTSTPIKVTVKETVRPVLNIPYDDAANQAIYVYSGETNNIELKVTDNSGKIVKAYLAMTAENRTGLGKEDNTYLNGKNRLGMYLNAEKIKTETTATEASPAVIRVTGDIPKNTYTESSGQITRYLFAEDAAGNTSYEHVGAKNDVGAPGRIRFVWKPQTFKYNAVAPSTPITSNTVPEASAIEKAVKDANPTFSDKIESVSVDGTNVKVTYKDGSTDVIPAKSVFTIEPTAPKVTPVKNPSSLTQPEKDAVKKAVETANKTATKVEVGTDGTTTLTYSNGSTATLKPAQTVKAADANGLKAPETKAPVKDTANLTDAEKAEVKKAVEAANPGSVAEVGQDGTTKVTFPDKSEGTLTPAQTVVKAEEKAKDADGLKAPETKTPVKDTANLTDAEKAEVKKAVEAANPGSVAEVGQDGTTKVTFPDKSEGTLTPAQTVVKAKDAAGIKEPATKTPVKDTANLTDDEKAEVKKAVEAANPGSVAEVGQDGTTKVTFPDKSEGTLTPAQTVVKAKDAAGIKEPATKTPVKDTANLTDGEKAEVKKAVEAANPGTVAEVGQDGTTKVTFPDKSEGTLTPAQTVVKAKDAAGIKEPATKTPVKDTANLTDDEKAEVKKAVEAANPGSVAEVGQDGTTKVTFPDKSEGTLTPAQTVVKAKDAAGIKEPATKTPVKDTANLTDAEKAEVKKAVEAANPGSVAEVGQDGTTKVTFPDKSEGTLTPAQTVVKAKDAAGIKEPATKTPVKDTANLTDDEKAEVKKAVEAANPGSVAEVGQDGTTKVTFPDKSEGTLTGDQTVKAADANGAKAPEAKTPVKDTSALTDEEKTQVAEEILKANPTLEDVDVANDGTATVTFPDGSKATLTPAQTVVKAEEKAKDADGLKAPETKTPVKDTANLTDGEKAEVKKAVEAANPGSVAEVGQDGTTKVTFPDKSEGTLTPAQTVVKAKDAAGIKEPATKTPVKDTANLTDDEKAEVKKAVEAANPGSVAEVGQDGTTKVTFPDKSEGTLTPAQTVVKAKDAAGIKEPATKTPVKDTANLTDDEKAEVKKAVEAANPGSVAEVGQDGTTKVTFPDKSEGTLTPAQTVVKAKDAAGIKEPATKTPVKDTANLTDGEKAEVKKAVEAANPGTVAEVGQDGTTKVTFPDKSEGTLTPAQTVVKAKDAAGIKEPATKTPVKDTANLTDDEKAEVKKAVEAANPGSVAEVGQDGTTKVTFPDKSEGTLTPAQTVVKAKDAAGIKEPATKTPVKDTANLTDAEKAEVKKAVEAANPGSVAEVGQDGTTKVTFPDKSEGTLTPAQTVVKAEEKAKDADGLKAPETKTPVKDTGNLTDAEKAEVKKAVEAANPGTVAEVGQDGTTKVTFPDKSEGTLTPAQTVVKAEEKAKDADGLKAPETKTPVKDTANLTDAEKAEVKKAVEAANPGSVAEVGQDGTTKVTFPDKSEGTLTPAQTVVKAKDAAGIKEPATKTPVKDTANLTDDEKAEVKKAVEAANPGTVAEVGQDGTTKVTFPDKSEGTLTGDQTVKAADANGAKAPEAKTPVKDTSALTDEEKTQVAEEILKANPTLEDVDVANDGTATVTFPDGSKATLTPAQTVVKAEEKAKDADGLKAPETKTPVKDTANLTEDEKAEVKKAVEAANPGSVAEVGQDGTTKVTFPDKSEGTLTPAQTVVKAEEKAKDADGLKAPETKTPVKDTGNLTDAEKAEVKKAVEAANPGTVAEVGQDGTTKVTFPDKSEGTLTPAQTVVKAEEKAKDADGLKAPETKTPVKDTANLTDDEKAEVKKAVEAANPGSVAEVGQDGTTKVTFPDKSEGTLTGDQTVKAADANGAKAPEAKTPVKDTSALTDEEKTQVAEEILKANPTLEDVDVANDGTATVTFPDGSKATLTPAQTVVKVEEKAKDADGLKAPETKTPVKDTANLTDAEKAEVKKAVEAANPGSVAEVGQDGTTKVTFPDKSEGTLTPAQTVVKAEEKAKDADGLKAPETKTPVKDTANLTDAEKAEVKKAVEAANPGSVAEVGQDGTTKVTFPDKSEGTLTPAQTVVKAEEKAKDADGLKAPETKTPVKDTANLTDAEKAEVKKAVEAANPGSVAEVGQDGTTKVTFPDGSKATLTPAQTVVKAEEKAKDADGLKAPETKTPVKDTANLTDAEKAEVKKAVEAANPGSVAEVGQDGTTKVTFPDKSEGTLTPAQTVVKAEEKAKDADGLKAPETKTPVKDTANLTDAEKAEVKKAVEAANPGSVAEVGQDGTTKVTFPDKSEGTLTPAQTVVKAEEKAKDADGLKAPETKTPVKDTANLTDAEKAEVKKAVEAANPGSVAEVGQDGTTKVTFPDKSEGTLTPAQTVVKAKDAAGIKEPATKTPVKDTANLTDDEKAEVKKAVEAANPGTVAEVGQDGTTKVTFPDGSKATLTPAQTVVKAEEKAKDADGLKAPETKTPVKDTANLTDAEKAEVKKAVEAANPGSVAEVGQDGTTKVTFPDKSEGTLTPAQTVVKAEEKAKDADGLKAPETKTPVKDTANLTDAEKAEVKKAVEAANPGSVAEVGQDGTTTVTFPDGSTATLTGDQTVKTADANGVQAPSTKTPVKDTANLTDAEKAKVKEAVEAANPGSKAEVGQDGTTTVTFPDGSTATLTGDQTVKTADANGVQAPSTKTPVKDTANLTDAEKAKVKEAVEAANPGSKAEVGQDGTTTVTFPDGSTATLTGDQTVKTADANGVQAPSTKTPVKDTANLTDAEKAKVKEAVEAANPGSKAEVGQDGTTTVTFPDGSTATLTGDQTVKTADSNGVQAPTTKTPVKDTANLTDAEKAKVKEAVEAANPGSKAEVGQDGTTTVTFPDGSTATLTGDQTVKTADANGVQAPTTKTPVKDTANLTDAEKAKVKEAVEAANPGSKAEVGQDGTTTVTFPDGSTATLTGDKTVTQADITAPTAPVVNPVKAGDTAVTGTAEAGSTVEVTLPDGTKVSAKADKDGKFSIPVNGLNAGDTVSVTATDESGNTSATTTVTVSNVNVGGKEADNAKVPALTPVVDPNNLTDAEKAKVAEEVKKANPTATDVKVNNDGSVVVTFADGSVATIAANKVVKEATKESSAQAPAKKAGAKELPNTGTKQSNASLGLALLAAVTGGLLVSKKRKEEE